MMYVDFTAGNKDYRLRLNTRAVVALEKQLGCNPLAIFGGGSTVPTITTMVQILHASLQQFHHGISLIDAYDIFDEYLADGKTAVEFIPVMLEIFQVSGLYKDNSTGTEKNEKTETEN